jgi:hypothetical protein
MFDKLSYKIKSDLKFSRIYETLLKNQYSETAESRLCLEDIKFMLQCASIFAHSSDDQFKEMSYKIASLLSISYSQEYENLNQITQYIFITLGDIPIIQKNTADGNKDYFSTYGESDIPFNPMTYKDVILKQALNQIPVNLGNKPIYLTDFQTKLFNILDMGNSVSISALPHQENLFFLRRSFQKNSRKINPLMSCI